MAWRPTRRHTHILFYTIYVCVYVCTSLGSGLKFYVSSRWCRSYCCCCCSCCCCWGFPGMQISQSEKGLSAWQFFFHLETLSTWQKVSRHSKACGKLRLKCFSLLQSLRTLSFIHGQERTVEFPVRLCSLTHHISEVMFTSYSRTRS